MNWSTYTKKPAQISKKRKKNDIPVENKKICAFTYNNFLKNRVQKLPISINFESKNNNKENEIGKIYIMYLICIRATNWVPIYTLPNKPVNHTIQN